jgi:zinc D-Ala-D-Ala carboxypeptidase
MKSAPPKKAKRSRFPQRLWFGAIVFVSAGLILILGSKLEQLIPTKNPIAPIAPPTPIAKISMSPIAPQPTAPNIPSPIATPKPKPLATPSGTGIATAKPLAANAFGHFPYGEAPPSELVSIGKFERENYEREEFLNVEAAQAFQRMLEAARSQNVQLMGISGFRSISDQQALFDKQIEKRGSAEAAAKLSAPPGHSEHHTGYALDITDASRTDVDLKLAFEDTAAYQWLVTNAAQYGFEQSFPQNNSQGVSYEPWHWRYVGSVRSAQIFTQARLRRDF